VLSLSQLIKNNGQEREGGRREGRKAGKDGRRAGIDCEHIETMSMLNETVTFLGKIF
jgi:hypothetical protein